MQRTKAALSFSSQRGALASAALCVEERARAAVSSHLCRGRRSPPLMANEGLRSVDAGGSMLDGDDIVGTYNLLSFISCISAPLYLLGLGLFSLVMHVSRAMLPRRLFALTFAASGALLLLVLLEIYGGLPGRDRWLLWRLHLSVDLALVVLILPFVLLKLTLRRALHRWPEVARWSLLCALFAAWLFLFYKVGDTFPTRGTSRGVEAPVSELLSLCLSRAGVFGVCLSALMSGFGAVAGLSLSLRRILHVDDPMEIDEAQRALVHALQRLAKHRLRLRGIIRRLSAADESERQRKLQAARVWSESQGEAARAVKVGDWSGAAKAVGTLATEATNDLARRLLRSSSQSAALGDLRDASDESLALRSAVRREMSAFARLLDDERRRIFSRTLIGRLLSAVGDVFSGYCVVKVGMATRSILRHGARRTGVDPVTRAIGYALRLSLVEPAAATLYSQGVSLVLIGIMIFSSVRGFLVQASRVALRIEHLEEKHVRRRQQRHHTPRSYSDAVRLGSAVPATPTATSNDAAKSEGDARSCASDACKTLPPSTPIAAGASTATASVGVESNTTPSSSGLADLVGATVAELMGIYLLSSVLMMRGSLPLEFRAGISEAAGDLEFEFYHHFFDAIFLASFLIAAVIHVTFQIYAARLRAARRLEQSVGSAVADQMAGVRRHHHAVQAAAERQRAMAADATSSSDRQASSDAIAAQAAAAQVAAQAASAAGPGREALLEFATAQLCAFDEDTHEHEA